MKHGPVHISEADAAHAGMDVPTGGSSCSTCAFLRPDHVNCGNKDFIAWNNGSAKIPGPIDGYCSNWYTPNRAAASIISKRG